MIIREAVKEDTEWIIQNMKTFWGSVRMVTRGKVHTITDLPGITAEISGERVGHLSYRIEGDSVEIVSLIAVVENLGIGSALLESVEEFSRKLNLRRIWLVTTNDNLRAFAFWQKRGYTIRAIYPGAIKYSRALKPEIPEVGESGIPIRDEIEMEKILH